jgi:hypothetical protein
MVSLAETAIGFPAGSNICSFPQGSFRGDFSVYPLKSCGIRYD